MAAPYFEEARSELADQLTIKREAIQSGMYLHEPDQLQTAINGYQQLNGQLASRGIEIVHDSGNATSPDSRNVVRWVRLSDDRRAVAKVVGNIEEGGEGDWLKEANRLRLPTIPLIAHGTLPVEVDGTMHTTQWVLTEAIEGNTLQRLLPPELSDEMVVATLNQLVPVLDQFHDAFRASGFRISRASAWEQRMMRHLKWTNPAVEAAGLALPDNWARGLRTLSNAPGRLTLHGDAAPVNTLVTSQGKILLFDPPGAVEGNPAADLGQMGAQVGNLDRYRTAIEILARRHPELDPDFIAAAAGYSFQQWAGYSAAEHSNPDASREGADPRERANALLGAARELTGPVNARFIAPGAALDGTSAA